jgi:hypothetical protein
MTAIACIAALLVAFALLGPTFFAGESRRRYIVVDGFVTVLAICGGLMGRRLGLDVDLRILFALVLVVKVVTLTVLGVRSAKHDESHFDAWRVAILAGAVYVVLVAWVGQTPMDGDEPYYLLVTESIVEDFDLDLRNQYSAIATSPVGRPNLKPFLGDPVGPNGEQYARYEPFLSVLLVPGYLLAGRLGATLTIALFALLFVRSFVRMLEDLNVPVTARIVSAGFVAFGPPVIFYAARIWPEMPAAFLITEVLRGLRSGRRLRWGVASVALALLKLRFIVILAPLLILAGGWRSRRRMLAALAVAALPMMAVALVSGSLLNVHRLEELRLHDPSLYLRGLSGVLLDGQAGLLFVAPAFFFALLLFRWREHSPEIKAFCVAALPYLFLLLPRPEWHGGWSPPLRYLVIFVPLLGLLLARAVESRLHPALVATLAAATAVIAAHGIAWPWRLFHIANGENWMGEWLSRIHLSDFSRLLPSTIRTNGAAWYWSAAALVMAFLAFLVTRRGHRFGASAPMVCAAGILLFSILGRQPAEVVHFEDAHVVKRGGALDPHEWTFARYLHAGGWKLREGDSLSFLHSGGEAVIHYRTGMEVVISVDGQRVSLRPDLRAAAVEVALRESGRHEIVCIQGEVILDRLERR